MDQVKQYDYIEATFTPIRTDDLRPEMATLVGQRIGPLQHVGFAEDNAYEGQAIFMAPIGPLPPYWIPECDLSDVVVVESPAETST